MSVYLACLGLVGIISLAAFAINPLQPGHAYTGPTGATGFYDYDNNMCKCNTVMYSLLSACDACQGIYWFRFDFHVHFPQALSSICY